MDFAASADPVRGCRNAIVTNNRISASSHRVKSLVLTQGSSLIRALHKISIEGLSNSFYNNNWALVYSFNIRFSDLVFNPSSRSQLN